MGRLDWDQNAYYQRVLLRQLLSRCERVLDVGCGAGALATRLASRVEQADRRAADVIGGRIRRATLS
jgi:ubiquinone/menaquinone biosynthesis C-methylase UbiE